MDRYALVVMAAADSPEGRGRMVHMLETARGLRAAGKHFEIWLHGAGVSWASVFDAGEERFAQAYGPLFAQVKDSIAGACDFCTDGRFQVGDAVRRLGIEVVGGEGRHHTAADLIGDGASIITF